MRVRAAELSLERDPASVMRWEGTSAQPGRLGCLPLMKSVKTEKKVKLTVEDSYIRLLEGSVNVENNKLLMNSMCELPSLF